MASLTIPGTAAADGTCSSSPRSKTSAATPRNAIGPGRLAPRPLPIAATARPPTPILTPAMTPLPSRLLPVGHLRDDGDIVQVLAGRLKDSERLHADQQTAADEVIAVGVLRVHVVGAEERDKPA